MVLQVLLGKVSNYRGTHPFMGRVFVGMSGLFAVLGVYSFLQSYSASKQIQYRKQQLRKPIVRLTEQLMVNPPWNKENIREWLYRRVEVTGKPIHRKACMVPRSASGLPGYEYVIPLIAKQDQNRQNRQGILFSKGFIPKRFKNPADRYKIQDVSKQTFVGFVSRLQQLSNHSLLSGNAPQPGRSYYTCADLKDFVETTELQNKKQAQVAVVQRLAETGVLDQRSSARYDFDCNYHQDYPHAKTEAGALQLDKMPWNYKNEGKAYFASAIASFIIGASIF